MAENIQSTVAAAMLAGARAGARCGQQILANKRYREHGEFIAKICDENKELRTKNNCLHEQRTELRLKLGRALKAVEERDRNIQTREQDFANAQAEIETLKTQNAQMRAQILKLPDTVASTAVLLKARETAHAHQINDLRLKLFNAHSAVEARDRYIEGIRQRRANIDMK